MMIPDVFTVFRPIPRLLSLVVLEILPCMLRTHPGRQPMDMVPQEISTMAILDMLMMLLLPMSEVLLSILLRTPQGIEILEMIPDMPRNTRIR
jgi:hypothetical protein